MLGAIIGDIVGSRFEFQEFKSKEFEFLVNSCKPTDDTFKTLAELTLIKFKFLEPKQNKFLKRLIMI